MTMRICSRCDKAARRTVRPYWQLDAELCPACCRHVASMHDLNHSWPPHPALVAA
jgi:hypothetical protein